LKIEDFQGESGVRGTLPARPRSAGSGTIHEPERRPPIAIQLLVENLAASTTESDLITLFSGVSRVRDVRLATDRATGASQGHALLAVDTQEGAERAIQRLDGYLLEGSRIQVREADRSRVTIHGAKTGLWGGGHAGSRPKGSRRGARARKRAL
jgi:RNA recognition motif-containing protein